MGTYSEMYLHMVQGYEMISFSVNEACIFGSVHVLN